MIQKFFLTTMLLLGISASAPAQVTLLTSTQEENSAVQGQSYSGVIRLRNDSKEPQEVKLYQTDYETFADGRTTYGSAGALDRSNASWIVITPARLLIPPGAEAVAKYTVRVPNAAKAGTYWSVIMAEPIASGSAESSRAVNARVHVGLETSLRYGIQMVTQLAGATTSDARLENAGAVKDEKNGYNFAIDLVNTGDVAYRPKLIVQVFSAAGDKLVEREAQRGLIYPGSSLRHNFELGAGLKGAYRIVIIADTGADDLIGAQYSVTL